MPFLHHSFPIHISLVLINPKDPANLSSLPDGPQLPEFEPTRQPSDPSSTERYIFVPPTPAAPSSSKAPTAALKPPIQFGVKLSVLTTALDFESDAIVFDVLIDGHEVARIALGCHAPLPPKLSYVVLGALWTGKRGVRTMHLVPLDVRADGEEGEAADWKRGGGEQIYRNPEFGSVVVHVSHAWGRRIAPDASALSGISGFVHEVLAGPTPPLRWVERIPRRFVKDGQTHRTALDIPDTRLIRCTPCTDALPGHRTKHIGSVTMRYRSLESLCAGGIVPDYRDAEAMTRLRSREPMQLSRNQLVGLVMWYKYRDEKAVRDRQLAEHGRGTGSERRRDDEGAGSASARRHTIGAERMSIQRVLGIDVGSNDGRKTRRT